MTNRPDTRRRAPGRPLRLTGAVVAACLGVACEQPIPEPVEVVRPVRMLTLGPASGSTPMEYPAQIAATTDSEIAFEVAGLITSFPVTQGQFVQQGDLLAQLDPRDYEAQLDAVRAERNVAFADYQRYQNLFSADAASLQELEVSRRRFEVADAQIRSAEKAVADTTLRAPFSGQVARRLVEDFQSVQARQPILILQDVEDTLDVIVNVPENDVAFRPTQDPEELDETSEVSVELTSFPGERIPVRLKEFASQADPITRTFELTFSFDPPDGLRILPGMTARVFATPRGRESAYRIPAIAVVSDAGGEAYVWVVDRGTMTVSRRDVEVAGLSGSDARVAAGLRNGETVAVSAAQNLREGMEIREIQY